MPPMPPMPSMDGENTQIGPNGISTPNMYMGPDGMRARTPDGYMEM